MIHEHEHAPSHEAKSQLVNLTLPVTITQSQTTTLQVVDIAQGYIAVNYQSPSGNNPTSYSNMLYVWLSQAFGSGVPWGQAPTASAPAQQGGTSISGAFSATPYVVGYSVGPSVTSGTSPTYPNVCATAEIPSDWVLDNVQYFSPTFSIITAQTNLITFSYTFPDGFTPSANGSWIGLWNGSVSSIYGTQPTKAAPISASTSNGQAPMTGLGLVPHGQYTVGLFCSGFSTDPAKIDLTTVAATLEFSTAASMI